MLAYVLSPFVLVFSLLIYGSPSSWMTQDPVPQPPVTKETECGAPAQEFTSSVVTLVLANSGHSQQEATDKAKNDVLNQLAAASGVRCTVCPNNLQCRRYADAEDSTFTAPQCQQNGTTNRWYCAIAHTGKYKVGCKDC
jgi:hypothetical protein